MVIVLNQHISPDQKRFLRDFLQGRGYQIREITGEEETIFGAVGPSTLDVREVEVLPGVQRVVPLTKPFKLVSREFKPEDTVVSVGPVRIGAGRVSLIAGPCAVESEDQMMRAGEAAADAGAVMLRGGAFKPRTSPYAFQGLGERGLEILKKAGESLGLPVVSEVVSAEHLTMMRGYVDCFQIGARNMQNFELLKSVGGMGMPVILKRGAAARIEEWLMAAEYLMAHGTDQIILCERGIRTFETYTRNSLDISSIPVVKKLSHLPVIVDPSHATGIRDKVLPVALGAVAAGADGLIVEIHPNPEEALSDGAQSLYPEQFEKLSGDIQALCPVLGKELNRRPKVVVASPGAAGASGGTAPGSPENSVLRVAFQGERGAYSEMALGRFFGFDSAQPVPCKHFEDVFQAVLKGEVQRGLLPIENALTGSIHENYDLLLQYRDIKIIGETKIRIQHSLIGVPGSTLEDIKRVYSHPQGLLQCERYLNTWPSWARIPHYDTAGSVSMIMKEGSKQSAAIANSLAAAIYGAQVLKEGIETNPVNYTRFVIIARNEVPDSPSPTKASIVFSTPDRPGALLEAMKVLSDRKVNLQKIESRPIHGKPWTYMFYLDLSLPQDPGVFQDALTELGNHTEDLRVLGRYVQA